MYILCIHMCVYIYIYIYITYIERDIPHTHMYIYIYICSPSASRWPSPGSVRCPRAPRRPWHNIIQAYDIV